MVAKELSKFNTAEFRSYIVYFYTLRLTQNNEKTNREGHKGHEVKRVSESFCVSPVLNYCIA
ncbi:MAG: hypothetical protein FWK04_22280 [Nostoc sp. GBBB01]|nr:hypothetical protein [Nostoc sp. GBBB01]